MKSNVDFVFKNFNRNAIEKYPAIPETNVAMTMISKSCELI